MSREDRHRHGIVLVTLALALFGSTTVIGYEGLISVLIPASAFFALATGVYNLWRSDDRE